jgi:peptidyl-prolyl cis-trans isomerase B (cyclophilin B)
MRYLSSLVLLFAICAAHGEEESHSTAVVLKTNKGEITLELHAAEAPVATANFIAYVEAGFYGGTIFHRVIPGFVAQGGGLTADMQRKETRPPIVNEADNGLLNDRGTVAMARTQDPHSASSQFFVNLADNEFLNHKSKTVRGWGYTVFARVVDGMDVVDQIAASPTGTKGGMRDVPVDPVVIESARLAGPSE